VAFPSLHLPTALLLGLALASPVRAGSVTDESIWDQGNALERARSQVPAGARETSHSCQTLQVRNDLRYRCTVEFSTDPAAIDNADGSQP
jgi:hypothetical protein